MANYTQERTARSRGSDNLERDAAALFAAMTDLLRVYQFRDRDKVGYHGLTITQSYVMEIVIRRTRLTLNELAAEMNLDKSTMSRVVDGLERKQAIKRTANPADGRSTLIEATPSGRPRRQRIEADIIAENVKVLSGFRPMVRRQLVSLIGELTRAARARELERVAEDSL
jgi:DNA-binding MarR family transcriptional regulator